MPLSFPTYALSVSNYDSSVANIWPIGSTLLRMFGTGHPMLAISADLYFVF